MSVVSQPTKRQTIKQHVVRWIQEQDLSPGDRLLSQNQLASLFNVTPVTVHKALTELADEGVVYREQGSGTFVGPSARCPATRSLCLILPAPHLDDPAYNPVYWPEVQTLYRAFLHVVGQRWTFSTRVVLPETPPALLDRELAAYHAIFFHHSRAPRGLFEHLTRERRLPVVAFGKPELGCPCFTIDHDPVAGAHAAIDYLVARGHRRIGLLACERHWGEEWLAGYRQGLAAHGLDADPALVVRTGETTADGGAAARELLARGVACDAIFVDSDIRALGAIEALREDGLRIPGDMAIVGYDGLESATRLYPYLSTVRIPYEEMIREALSVVEANANQPLPVGHFTYTGRIVPGRTTD